MTSEITYRAGEYLSMETELSILEKMIGPKYPCYIDTFKEVDNFINNYLINTDEIAAKFYKQDVKKNASIVFEFGPGLSKFIENGDDCVIKRRVSNIINGGSKKVKADYVKKDNPNFISVIKSDDSLLFTSLSESQFKKAITVIKKVIISRGCDALLQRKASKLSSDAKSILSRFSYADTSRAVYRYIQSTNTVINESNFDKVAVNIIKSLIKLRFIGTSTKLPSMLINLFDTQKRNEKILKENTTTERYTDVNPVSNFLSIKSRRVIKSNCENKAQVEAAIRDEKSTVEFLSSVAREVEKNIVEINGANDYSVKIVEPGSIAALYNVSSYHGSSYNLDGSDSVCAKMPSGTLFNSCMRRPHSKYDVSFYDNSGYNKMLVVSDKLNKKIKARAIIWYDKENDINYVDRVYYTDDKQVSLMAKFIESKENFKVIHSSLFSYVDKSKHCSSMKIKVEPVEMSTGMPYLDSVSMSFNKVGDTYYIFSKSSSIDEKNLSKFALNKWKAGGEVKPLKLVERSGHCSWCGHSAPISELISCDDQLICPSHYSKTEIPNVYRYGRDSIIEIIDGYTTKKSVVHMSFEGVVVPPEFVSECSNAEQLAFSFVMHKGILAHGSSEDELTMISYDSSSNKYTTTRYGRKKFLDKIIYDNRRYKVVSIAGIELLFPVNPDKEDYRLLNTSAKIAYSNKNELQLLIKDQEKVIALNSLINRGDVDMDSMEWISRPITVNRASNSDSSVIVGNKVYPIVYFRSPHTRKSRTLISSVSIVNKDGAKLDVDALIDSQIKELQKNK